LALWLAALRTNYFRDTAHDVEVRPNDWPLAVLADGGYSWLHLAPGRYVVSMGSLSGNPPVVREFELEPKSVSALFLSRIPPRARPTGGVVFAGPLVLPAYRNVCARPSPFAWGFLADFPHSSRYADMKKRAYEAPLTSDFMPIP